MAANRHTLPWALSVLALFTMTARAGDPVSDPAGHQPGLRLPHLAGQSAAWRTAPLARLGDTPSWNVRADWHRQPAGAAEVIDTGMRWRLLGDYYFASIQGLRATGGWIGQTSPDGGLRLGSASGIGPRRNTPYAGLGYSTGGINANRWGGWGLSADIGVQAARGGVDPLTGRALDSSGTGGAGGNVADLLRELRLTPVLQLGVSYAF